MAALHGCERSGQPAYPTVWLTYFDRAGSAPRAWRVTGTEPLPDPEGAWVRSCLGEIGPAGARGVIDAADVAGGVAGELAAELAAPRAGAGLSAGAVAV